jgi:hypothetical protein
MPRAISCDIDGETIDVEEALLMRDDPTYARNGVIDLVTNFRCLDCGQSVVPHKASRNGQAHFEHKARNPNCPMSDPAR